MRDILSRSFLATLLLVLGATSTASAIEVVTTNVEFPGSSGPVKGVLSRPTGDGPFPAIVVIHEWWGLTDWVKDNGRKLAENGYATLSVDLYNGRATADPGEAHELMRALNQSEAVADLKGSIAYLRKQKFVAAGRIGSIGWCMGGGLSRELAQASADVGASVICYGAVTLDPEQAGKLKGKSILGIFGAADRGIKADDVRKFGKLLTDQGAKNDVHIYEGAGHGFMRAPGPQFNEKATDDAWKRIREFFAANLKPSA